MNYSTAAQILLLTIGVLLLPACGDESIEDRINRNIAETVTSTVERAGGVTDQDKAEAKETMDEIAREQLAKKHGVDPESIDVSGVELVNFRELKKLLPTSLGGLERTDIEGTTQKNAFISASTATAKYGQKDQKLEAQLLDGGTAGASLITMMGLTTGYEHEDDNGYARAATFKEYRSYEKQEQRDGELESSLSIIVHDRFILMLEGENLTVEQLIDAADDIRLDLLPNQVVIKE